MMRAQEGAIHRFERITVENGLPMNGVNKTVQDKDGFMWFGTQDGLCRYDGTTIKIFRRQDKDSMSLAGNFIQTLLVTRTGTLIIGTSEGLAVYNALTETFTNYRNNPKNPSSLTANYIMGLYEDSNGLVWISTQEGLNIFQPATGAMRTIVSKDQHPDFMASVYCMNVLELPDKRLAIATKQGIYLWNPATSTVEPYHEILRALQPTNVYIQSRHIATLHLDHANRLWLGTIDAGLICIDLATERVQHFEHHPTKANSINSNNIRDIDHDVHGNIWILNYSAGLNILNPTTGAIQSYEQNPFDNQSLPTNELRQVLFDRSGIAWIGTDFGGVVKIDPRVQRIHTLRNRVGIANSLSGNLIRSLCEDAQGNWWVGTGSSGLNKFNPATGTWTLWRKDTIGVRNGIAGWSVWGLVPTRNGKNLWVGTNEGLNLLDIATGRILKTYKRDSSKKNNAEYALPMNSVRTVCLAPNDDVWVGLRTGSIARLDVKTGRFHSIKLNATNIHDMLVDREGRLWVGTWGGGLQVFSANTGAYIGGYRTDPAKPNGIPTDVIRSLYEDSKGRLWLGTMVGLVQFDKLTGQCTIISEKDGLPNNVIYKILEDNAGNFWISTNKGVCRLNLATKDIRVYDRSAGMQDNEFNATVGWKLRDGRMMFGGVSGFSVFHPDSLTPNTMPPPVVLTDFRVFNQPFPLDTAIAYKHSIALGYNQNFFTISYSALSYTATGLQRFRYKMIGFDEQWIEANTEREATYTNLDPGTYTFHVIACNNDGVWNPVGRQLTITVIPPWWKTWWFRGGMMALLVGVVVMGIRLRLRQLEHINSTLNIQVKARTKALVEKNEELELLNTALAQADTFKTKMLAMASHDLKSPLSNILGFTKFLLDNNVSNEDRLEFAEYIDESARKMHGLIVDLLDVAARERGVIMLNLADVNINDIVDELVKQYTVHAQNKQQTIRYAAYTQAMVVGDKARLEQVFENLISNALKYTEPGKTIDVVITEEQDMVRCTVRDQGQGLSEDDMKLLFREFQKLSSKPTGGEHSSGIGLSIVKQIVELHKGKISAESEGKGKGSAFIVELPKYTA